jgi:hypothetical protein
MDFKNKSIYKLLKKGEPYIFSHLGKIIEIDTLVIPEGTILYRADPEGSKKSEGKFPEFVGDKKSASEYAWGDIPLSEQLSTYKVLKDLRFIDWNYDNILKIKDHPKLTKKERRVFEYYFNKQTKFKEDKYVSPLGFLNGSFLHGVSKYKTEERFNYINRLVINIICKLGYTGWIVKPGSLLQYHKDMNLVIEYDPEIVICPNIYDKVEYIDKKIKKTRKIKKRLNKTRKV